MDRIQQLKSACHVLWQVWMDAKKNPDLSQDDVRKCEDAYKQVQRKYESMVTKND